MQAALPEGGVPTEEELLELLGQAARCGSVPAIKELLACHREREGKSDDGLAEFERARGAGGMVTPAAPRPARGATPTAFFRKTAEVRVSPSVRVG
jgi:hypothetical protein